MNPAPNPVVETALMMALVNGLPGSLFHALRRVGTSRESALALAALARVPAPELQSIVTFAAAGVLPDLVQAVTRATPPFDTLEVKP